MNIVNSEIQVYIMLKGMVDFAAEIKKLEKKKTKVEPALKSLKAKMAMPSYEEKTPDAVKNKNNDKLAAYEKEICDLNTAIEGFKKLC